MDAQFVKLKRQASGFSLFNQFPTNFISLQDTSGEKFVLTLKTDSCSLGNEQIFLFFRR